MTSQYYGEQIEVTCPHCGAKNDYVIGDVQHNHCYMCMSSLFDAAHEKMREMGMLYETPKFLPRGDLR